MDDSLTTRVFINGEAREVAAGATIESLLREIGLGDHACAVEVNRALVPKREHARCALRAGDEVEIVTLVGGG